jgi:hypothetical protein
MKTIFFNRKDVFLNRKDAKGSAKVAKTLAAILCALCGTFASLRLNAQTVQVVTKVVEKTIPCPDGLTQRIHLNARKADVQVRGWNRPVVGIRLRLVAKHPDRVVAEREVAYHQYTLQVSGSVIDLANSFVIPQRAGKLQSQLKAIYEVRVPNRALLTVSNSFGDVDLRDLAGETEVTFEYGLLSLDTIEGKLTLDTHYGDVVGTELKATFNCTAEKSTVILRKHGGNSTIRGQYSKLFALPNTDSFAGMSVEADHSSVRLMVVNVDDFRYDLKAVDERLMLPKTYASELTRKHHTEQFQYELSTNKPLIRVTGKDNPISLITSGGVTLSTK